MASIEEKCVLFQGIKNEEKERISHVSRHKIQTKTNLLSEGPCQLKRWKVYHRVVGTMHISDLAEEALRHQVSEMYNILIVSSFEGVIGVIGDGATPRQAIGVDFV